MAKTKKTKKEMYAEIREMVIDNQEMVDFIDHQIELLNWKSSGSRKPTKTQLENEVFKEKILETLAEVDTPITIKELVAECDALEGLSNQRITHMLTALRKDEKVTRTYVKKVAHFEIFKAEDEDVEE